MPWSPEQKIQTREKILHSAARLFTRNGFEKVSINDVMQQAGLTRGAFYKHFASKSELYSEAIVYGARKVAAERKSRATDMKAVLEAYLSRDHVETVDDACPLAFLVSDIAQQGNIDQKAYQQVLEGLVKALAKESGQSEDTALLSSILMIGGVALARAVNDESLSDRILSVARDETRKQLIENCSE